jgi:Kef-type K+ transport system membrane component KefB
VHLLHELFHLDMTTGPTREFLAVVVAIIVGPLLAERARIPGIIGLLVAGLVIGPHGLGIIHQTDAVVPALGHLGLLYLMFLAGLELDLEVFRHNRRAAGVFALITFSLPMLFGASSALALGFAAAAALLMGAVWASHTLVVYPVFQRYGLTTNRAVATSVGATVLTDTLALVVLAGVAGVTTGKVSGPVLLVRILIGLALLLAWCFVALPWIARWFFAGLGQQRTLRFVFVLACLLSAGVVAQVLGIEDIVGAFFAGLALNRLVPNGGPLMERIEFFGSALLIPLFLLSVGLIIDPAVVANPATLTLAGVFALACFGGKALAATATRRVLGFSWAEVGAVFSLTSAQAAATLAATFVGFDIGLISQRVVNAVLIVIAISLLLASVLANRAARRIQPAVVSGRRLGRAVILPVVTLEPFGQLTWLADRIAEADGGVVVPVRVSPLAGQDRGRELLDGASAIIGHQGLDADVLQRVDQTVESGILHTVVSERGSLLLLAASFHAVARRISPRGLEDQVASASPVPTVLLGPAGEPVQRVVLALSPADLNAVEPSLPVAIELAARLRRGGLHLDVVVPERARGTPPLTPLEGCNFNFSGDRIDWCRRNIRPGTLVILPVRRSWSTTAPDAATLAAQDGCSVAVVAAPHTSGDGNADQAIKVVVGRGQDHHHSTPEPV